MWSSIFRGLSPHRTYADLEHLALPILLAHCGLILVPAMVMSIIGGLLIYGTIISFTMFFQEEQDF